MQDAKIGLIQFCLSAPKTDMESNIQALMTSDFRHIHLRRRVICPEVRDYAQMDRLLREERTLLVHTLAFAVSEGLYVSGSSDARPRW